MGTFWGFFEPLGGLVGASWGPLGNLLEPPGDLLGRRARFFGSSSLSWAPLGAVLGHCKHPLGGRSRALSGAPGRSWGYSGGPGVDRVGLRDGDPASKGPITGEDVLQKLLRRPKRASSRSKIAPRRLRGPQDGPRGHQDDPKGLQEAAQECPRRVGGPGGAHQSAREDLRRASKWA